MDVVNKVLLDFKFIRLGECNCNYKVILGVPGCGKSSCIRTILSLDSRFIAITFGVPDPFNTSGRRIISPKEYAARQSEGKFLLIDEFQSSDISGLSPLAVFGDICQFTDPNITPPLASWHKTLSHRVSASASLYLRKLGFEIFSDREGSLTFGGLYVAELVGTVICYCDKVSELLRAHGVEHHTLESCRGKEFDSVTLCLHDSTIPREDLGKFYLCFTRSRGSLLCLTPDAVEPST